VLSAQQVADFHEDGFLIIQEGFIPDATVEALRERFDALFAGEYETGIAPDEVNWKGGRDPEDRTRQICNGWRADDTVAAQVLSEKTGRLAAQLMAIAGRGCSRTTASGSRRGRRPWGCTRTARMPATSSGPR
jgi:hypothetical protein